MAGLGAVIAQFFRNELFESAKKLDSGFRRNDDEHVRHCAFLLVTPAEAGVQLWTFAT
jgi:hypothetical protein